MYILFAAQDLFSIGQNLATKLGHLGASVLALVIGVIVAGHIARHSAGAAIVVVLLAIIPAWFLLDPSGAVNTLKATINGIS